VINQSEIIDYLTSGKSPNPSSASVFSKEVKLKVPIPL